MLGASLVAQEAIKMITRQYVPQNGYCVVDCIAMRTGIIGCIGPDLYHSVARYKMPSARVVGALLQIMMAALHHPP